MTISDAIWVLESQKNGGFLKFPPEDHFDALNLAIKALEKMEQSNDLIMRKEAIAETYRDCTNVKTDEDAYKVLSKIRDGINSLQSYLVENSWVSIHNHLPDKELCIKNNCLFIVSDGYRTYSEWFDPESKHFGEHTMSGFTVDHAVTFWQSLPNPPQSEQTGDPRWLIHIKGNNLNENT